MNLEKTFNDAVGAFEAGDLRRAEKVLKKLDSAAPNQHPVLHLRGLVALRDKRYKNAVHYLKRAVAMRASPDLLNALGSAHSSAGDTDAAVEVLSQVLSMQPGNPDAAYNLANALKAGARHADALTHYQAAIAAEPGFADAYYNMGLSLGALWRFDEAVAAYRRCLEINPQDSEAMKNLANAYYKLNDNENAAVHARGAVALNPDDADAHYNLANILQRQNAFDEAYSAFERAIVLDPAAATYKFNFAMLQKDLGEVDEGIACLRALNKTGTFPHEAHSNLIFSMLNSPAFDAGDIRKEAERWNTRHARPLAPKQVRHGNEPKPDRKLKVGYLSADLSQHPVGFFMEPVFAHHDKASYEVHVFSTNVREDKVTERLKGYADSWQNVAPLELPDLVETIRAQEIDILVDLTGHGANNRLRALACRPAPVQLLGGGLFCTSGLECVDGFLSDRFQTPDGAEAYYTEPLIRLPDGYVCYRPPDYAADVAPSPCLEDGFVTFGCFNNLSKISAPAAALWAGILNRVPQSRLLLKTPALSSVRAQERLREQFAALGIDEARLLLEPGLPHEAFMAEYARVDIALDPFPYSGGLTTLEALWMGVPVVTLPGDTFAARHSLSHLSNLGLTDLICDSAEAYAEKAVALAADAGALDALRQSIRPRMAASPIVDGERYTRNLEQVYRARWQAWCDARRA